MAELSPATPVESAFLEFMTPDLATAVDTLVARGATALVVAPVFLAAGGHVLRDLPDRLAAITARHPGLAVRVEPALGSLPAVVDAMAQHCLGTVSGVR
jgi:sirohydrochlorin cobaltochelatase